MKSKLGKVIHYGTFKGNFIRMDVDELEGDERKRPNLYMVFNNEIIRDIDYDESGMDYWTQLFEVKSRIERPLRVWLMVK